MSEFVEHLPVGVGHAFCIIVKSALACIDVVSNKFSHESNWVWFAYTISLDTFYWCGSITSLRNTSFQKTFLGTCFSEKWGALSTEAYILTLILRFSLVIFTVYFHRSQMSDVHPMIDPITSGNVPTNNASLCKCATTKTRWV